MNRLLAPCLALSLTACPGASTTADSTAVTTVMAAYTLAATGVASYAGAPGANPAVVRTVRACEMSAWLLVRPVAAALLAKTSPTTAAVAAASGAVSQLQSCMANAGVPAA